jgi:hypothetical protein
LADALASQPTVWIRSCCGVWNNGYPWALPLEMFKILGIYNTIFRAFKKTLIDSLKIRERT